MGAAYDALAALQGNAAWPQAGIPPAMSLAHRRQMRIQQTGRVGNADKATQDAASRGDRAPVWPQGAVRQSAIHHPNRGLSKLESDGILNVLYDHCQKPEFQCRVRWGNGDVTHVGQPCHMAQGDQRLSRPSPLHAPGHRRGCLLTAA
ncbi:MAG: hypothetical protein R3D29_11660 [Nitratireductor sp.]